MTDWIAPRRRGRPTSRPSSLRDLLLRLELTALGVVRPIVRIPITAAGSST
jgi:hypothetical protein